MPNGECACQYHKGKKIKDDKGKDKECDSQGKHPIQLDWNEGNGTTDQGRIKGWWKKWPRANVGILTGTRSGILLLDVDLKDDGPGELSELVIPKSLVRETLRELTPECIEHTYKKIEEYSREKGIKNPKQYTQAVLYNSVADEPVSMTTEINYKIHGNGRKNN